jgi:hypothetical protein
MRSAPGSVIFQFAKITLVENETETFLSFWRDFGISWGKLKVFK